MRHSTVATWRRSCLTPRATAWGHNGRPRAPPKATGAQRHNGEVLRTTTSAPQQENQLMLHFGWCRRLVGLSRMAAKTMLATHDTGFVSSSWWLNYDTYGFWFIYTTTFLAENPRSHVNIVNFPSTCLCLTSPFSNFGFVFSGDTVDLRAEKRSNVKTSKRRTFESRIRSNATGNLKIEGYCCRIDWNTVILACSSVAIQGPASSRETHIVCNMNKQEQLRGKHTNLWYQASKQNINKS